MRLLLHLLSAALSGKTVSALLMDLVLTPVLVFTERYLFKAWNFLGSLGMLILVDTVFGVQYHWQRRSISSRAFSRLFTKAGIYLGLLVLTHHLTGYQMQGEVNGVFSAWFAKFMYAAMMAREALSILEHVRELEPRLVPKLLLKRLALLSEGEPDAAPPGPEAPSTSPSNAQ